MLLLISLLFASLASAERPFQEMTRHRNSTHFLPHMCCQWCGPGEQWKDFMYVHGRCRYFPDAFPTFSSVALQLHLTPEHLPVIHHPQSCCYFCGYYPGEYNFHVYGNGTAHEGYCQRKQSMADYPESPKGCAFCTAFVGFFKTYLTVLSPEQFSEKIMNFCRTSILEGVCIKYVMEFSGIIKMLIDSNKSTLDICSIGLRMCPIQSEIDLQILSNRMHFIYVFYAPTSIKALLDPAKDGNPLTPAEIMNMPNIDYTTLRGLIAFDARTPEEHLQNLKFAARYGLIFNQRECGCSGHGYGSLIKRTGVVDGWIWRCADCKREGSTVQVSVRDRSFLSLFDKPIEVVLRLAEKWCHSPYQNYDQIEAELGIRRQFLVNIYGIFRDLAQSWFEREALRTPLGGPGTIVEIDESVLFRRKYHRGHVLRKQVWVFGMVERGTNRVGMFIVKRRDAATLLPLIKNHIAPGTTITSDGWAAYRGIQHLQQQFDHRWVNHRLHFVDPSDPTIHTQSIESTWGAAKKLIKRIQNLSTDELNGYLCQYMFRRRFLNEKMVNKLLAEMSLYDIDNDDLSELDENSEDEIVNVPALE